MRLKAIFIQNLRKYRKHRNISQMALAEKCSTSTAYIGQIEIGNRFPSLDMIEKIAVALQIRPYLLFWDEPNEANEIFIDKMETIPDSTKDKLIKDLTAAVHRIVKRIK
jgi:transcriptional regulator with XRE-family HTH domain